MSTAASSDNDSKGEDNRGEGFWTFIRRTRPVNRFDNETTRRIEKRQRLVCTKGYGISYDWITQPQGHMSRNGGQYAWTSVDHYFGGVTKEEFDKVMGRFPAMKLKKQEEILDEVNGASANINVPYLDVQSRDTTGFMDYEDYVIVPDHLFKSESSNLPSPQDMEGTYDIIYYGGDADGFLGMHYRTARGTVELSTAESDHDGRMMSVIEGKVTMHPCMEEIDVIPFGGECSFVERARVQREGYRNERNYEDENDTKKNLRMQPTGVIKIEVTDPPNGMCSNDGRRQWLEKDNVHIGEIRIFRSKVGTGITNQIPRRFLPHTEVSFDSTEEAEEINKVHYTKTCSWLHKHTILDESASSKIGEFLCPPPVLFFMEGDIQIDINWRDVAPECPHANSFIIARRRAAAGVHSGPMVSNQNKYDREMSLIQGQINKLEQKKDMIFLAYFCAELVSTSGSLTVGIPYFWSGGGPQMEKFDRCFTYMDKKVFSEQLFLYGLQLKNIQLIHHGSVSERRITFTRV